MSRLRTLLAEKFPDLQHKTLIAEMEKHSRLMTANPGDMLVKTNDYVKVVPLVTKGSIKVSRDDGEGHALFLYHIEPGQSCAMSLKSCLGEERSRIKGEADSLTELIAIPSSFIEPWMTEFPAFKRFVINTFSQRYDELLSMIDTIAFEKMDRRIMTCLRQHARAGDGSTVRLTHQKVADELNTSREVVSRLLKVMERNGQVRLGRTTIEIL
ncbi:MAG TPA: Crp/Fnr family transcriptional regulator [bacterium]|nr:Crp/Fnr family transcriptional regulator [bacterium]